MLFFRVLQHLLPRGAAWRVTIDKTLRRFFLGLSEQPQETRDYIDKVYLDLFPATARSATDTGIAVEERSGALEEWERQFGLQPADLADFAARRAAVAAEWQAIGGQSPAYIQGVLQAAGFPIFVHEWWSSGPPYVARDPRDFTTQPLVGIYQCEGDEFGGVGGSQPQCTEFDAIDGHRIPGQPQCNDFLANEIGYLVNKDLTRRAPPRVPDDDTKWPYFIYLSGDATDIDAPAFVPIARRDELERLLLKLRPTQNWIVTSRISYTGDGSGDLWLTEGGDFIITEGGDFFEIE